MRLTTVLLIRTEMRSLFNQFRRTISNPSMLTFYGTSLVGAYFVSNLLSTLIGFTPMFSGISEIFQTNIDASILYSGFAIISFIAVIRGYLGIGAASVLVHTDEHVIMPAPILPYQVYLTRYVRRLIRRLVYVGIAIFVLLPVMNSGSIRIIDISLSIVCILSFFEANYFLGGICGHYKKRLAEKSNLIIRYLPIILLAILLFVPLLDGLRYNPIILYFSPAITTVSLLLNVSGLAMTGTSPLVLISGLFLSTMILGLLMSNLFNYEDYEIYSTNLEIEESSKLSIGFVTGQVDFSNTRFNDPTIWIILKDFWTRMRSPTQFWKYIYVIFGTLFVVFLAIFRPLWIVPIKVPGEFNYAAIPAFLIMVIMISQMTSVTSLLSFVDERENIYLLKVSPFSSKDIVLGKYVLSLFEAIIAAIPILGVLTYLLQVENALALITLSIPCLLIFTATGIMFGAYIPVFTNEPNTAPIPLAFAFPTLNLILGAIIVYILIATQAGILFMIVIPILTLGLVILFLALSLIALRSYL